MHNFPIKLDNNGTEIGKISIMQRRVKHFVEIGSYTVVGPNKGITKVFENGSNKGIFHNSLISKIFTKFLQKPPKFFKKPLFS